MSGHTFPYADVTVADVAANPNLIPLDDLKAGLALAKSTAAADTAEYNQLRRQGVPAGEVGPITKKLDQDHYTTAHIIYLLVTAEKGLGLPITPVA